MSEVESKYRDSFAGFFKDREAGAASGLRIGADLALREAYYRQIASSKGMPMEFNVDRGRTRAMAEIALNNIPNRLALAAQDASTSADMLQVFTDYNQVSGMIAEFNNAGIIKLINVIGVKTDSVKS